MTKFDENLSNRLEIFIKNPRGVGGIFDPSILIGLNLSFVQHSSIDFNLILVYVFVLGIKLEKLVLSIADLSHFMMFYGSCILNIKNDVGVMYQSIPSVTIRPSNPEVTWFKIWQIQATRANVLSNVSRAFLGPFIS